MAIADFKELQGLEDSDTGVQNMELWGIPSCDRSVYRVLRQSTFNIYYTPDDADRPGPAGHSMPKVKY